MKIHSVLSFCTEWLLSLLLAAASLGCMVSGLGIQVQHSSLLLAVFFWTLAGMAASRFRKGWIFLLTGAVCYAGILLADGLWKDITYLQALLRHLGHLAYGWETTNQIEAMGVQAMQRDLTQACLALGMFSSALSAWIIGSRKSAFWCIPAIVLPLGMTLLVLDTVPSATWIIVLFLGVALLMMTHSTRRRDPAQGAKLVLLLLLPLTLCVNFLMEANPQNAYEAPDDLLSFLFQRADDLPFIQVGNNGQITIDPQDTGTERVNLGSVGPKSQSQRLIMRVNTHYSGVLYLRAQGYSEYTGTRWTNNNSPDEVFTVEQSYRQIAHWPAGIDPPKENILTISTIITRPRAYVPYYPTESLMLKKGKAESPNSPEYHYVINPLAENWKQLWYERQGNGPIFAVGDSTVAPALENYLQLPQKTYEKAQSYLQQLSISPQTQVISAAERIEALVKSSAQYSLSTQRMPRDAEDFVMWFLEDSPTGYCIHYASAAVVLLRAAGIPARYVEGYTLQIPSPDMRDPEEDITVREAMAHAWVEYYVPDVGWVILDPTPAEGIVTIPPTQTQPSTAPSTEPTTQPITTPSAPTTQPTTRPGTRPSTVPSTPAAAPQAPQIPGEVFVGFGATVAVVLTLWLQWLLRLRRRLKKLHQGSPNQQALNRWKYVRRLARLRGQEPPEDLLALANKARFSQHTLTGQELGAFEAYVEESITALRSRNLLWQLVYRLIFAVY